MLCRDGSTCRPGWWESSAWSHVPQAYSLGDWKDRFTQTPAWPDTYVNCLPHSLAAQHGYAEHASVQASKTTGELPRPVGLHFRATFFILVDIPPKQDLNFLHTAQESLVSSKCTNCAWPDCRTGAPAVCGLCLCRKTNYIKTDF